MSLKERIKTSLEKYSERDKEKQRISKEVKITSWGLSYPLFAVVFSLCVIFVISQFQGYNVEATVTLNPMEFSNYIFLILGIGLVCGSFLGIISTKNYIINLLLEAEKQAEYFDKEQKKEVL